MKGKAFVSFQKKQLFAEVNWYGHDGGGAAQFQDSTKRTVILFMSSLFLIINIFICVCFGLGLSNQIREVH